MTLKKSSKKAVKSDFVQVRMNKAEIKLLEARAKARGMKPSTYMRMRACYEADALISVEVREVVEGVARRFHPIK